MRGIEVQLSEMIFEVTRKCNMSCRHCLRGHSEDVDMDRKTVDAALEQVAAIGTIVFTGGEPTLNVPIIRYIVDQIIARKIACHSFFVATNGLVYSEDLVSALLDLYAYCESCEGELELCELAVSMDEFHDDIKMVNYLKYKELEFYSSSKERLYEGEGILDEGMAKEYGIGSTSAEYGRAQLRCNEHSDDSVWLSTIYVNALGGVVNNCDMSYQTQNAYTIGSLNDNSLLDIIIGTNPELFNYYNQKKIA